MHWNDDAKTPGGLLWEWKFQRRQLATASRVGGLYLSSERRNTARLLRVMVRRRLLRAVPAVSGCYLATVARPASSAA